MKKVLLISLFLVWAIMAQGENVSMQTAQTAAQSFLNSKTGGNPQIHLIDYAEKAEFPNFYVFGNESCFVIIAADDCVHPVLAYSTESTFETSGMPTNTYGWLKAYNKEIEYIADCRPEVNPEIQLEWENLLNGRGLDPKSARRLLRLPCNYELFWWRVGPVEHRQCYSGQSNIYHQHFS